MADYWKSGERHFCTFCKCWLAGNKVSINLHEGGNHHKSMVRSKLEQLRKANIEKERQDKQMHETLGKIELAANESYRRDMVAQAASQLDSSAPSNADLPSKLKRHVNEPIQVQCKKPKFVIKTPTPKPVFEPIATPTESDKVVAVVEPKPEPSPKEEEEEEAPNTDTTNQEGTWYESKTDTQESFYWNDITGESTWTPPAVYLSIEQQRAKGLKV
jgi:WW domain-binding protein 4